MPEYQVIDPGFVVADAEDIQFSLLDDRELRLWFTDWKEQRTMVTFHGVVGVRWQEAELAVLAAPYDGVCLVQGSPWLGAHLEQGIMGSEEGHVHYMLCFNASGGLEVLATSHTCQ
jgi:hypothetical protein